MTAFPDSWTIVGGCLMTIQGFQSKRYAILSVLGSGGMGEVYRGRDRILGREVAIKVLSEKISGNPESLSRFEVEAKALASLSHPNILTIYDFVNENGKSFAVMELLKGETLATRLSNAKLPLEQSMQFALAIAEGLSAAHKAGVIHRDLKPANIFLLENGGVKILDFGLARLVSPDSTLLKEETTEAKLTVPGMIMGTAAYMSPEQARGESLDERTDIFSFGIVLYEMLTGELPFPGRNTGEILESLFAKQP